MLSRIFVSIAFVLTAATVFAADEAAKTPQKYVDPNPWEHQTKRLDRNQIDKLLGHPEKLLIIDVRRPDELTKTGGFPIYLSIQAKNIEESLEYIPKGRQIITVSNRAHRAGVVGDILIAKGFKVAGAAGVLDYQDAGGSLTKIAAPAPKVAPVPATASAPAASVAK